MQSGYKKVKIKSVNLQHNEFKFTLHVSATYKFAICRIYLINKEVIESSENHYRNALKIYTVSNLLSETMNK